MVNASYALTVFKSSRRFAAAMARTKFGALRRLPEQVRTLPPANFHH
jgi:hypothetical protein